MPPAIFNTRPELSLIDTRARSYTHTNAQVSKGSQYPTLLKALMVQSMIKIEEDKVTVICREADIEAVKSVVDVRFPPLYIHARGGVVIFRHPVVLGPIHPSELD